MGTHNKYHRIVWDEAKKETKHDLFGSIQNLVGDIVIAVASGLLYAFWSYYRQGTMIDWLGVVFSVFGGFIIWGLGLFVYNLLRKIPAKLYIEKDKVASRYNWDYISIDKTEISDNDTFVAYGILVKNEKEYDLRTVIAQIQYLEIDGKSYIENRQLLQTQKGRRLGWLWNSHRIETTVQSLDKNGFVATLDLFRLTSREISYFEFAEQSNGYEAKNKKVESIARGELLFLAGYHVYRDIAEWIPIENIYNFSITINGSEKPKMIIGKGRIYKPPEIER